MLDLKLDTRKK